MIEALAMVFVPIGVLLGFVVGVTLDRGSFPWQRRPSRNLLRLELLMARESRDEWKDRAYAYQLELKKMHQKFSWADEEQYVIQEQEIP